MFNAGEEKKVKEEDLFTFPCTSSNTLIYTNLPPPTPPWLVASDTIWYHACMSGYVSDLTGVRNVDVEPEAALARGLNASLCFCYRRYSSSVSLTKKRQPGAGGGDPPNGWSPPGSTTVWEEALSFRVLSNRLRRPLKQPVAAVRRSPRPLLAAATVVLSFRVDARYAWRLI